MKGMSPDRRRHLLRATAVDEAGFCAWQFWRPVRQRGADRHARHVAVPIFVASLAGYIALYAGDYAYGVFDVIPGQLTILSVVVAIAAALCAAGVTALRQNLLR